MKHNPHVIIGANVVRALVADPSRSNLDIARDLSLSEGGIRRYRTLLELSGVIPTMDAHIGADGVQRSIPNSF